MIQMHFYEGESYNPILGTKNLGDLESSWA